MCGVVAYLLFYAWGYRLAKQWRTRLSLSIPPTYSSTRTSSGISGARGSPCPKLYDLRSIPLARVSRLSLTTPRNSRHAALLRHIREHLKAKAAQEDKQGHLDLGDTEAVANAVSRPADKRHQVGVDPWRFDCWLGRVPVGVELCAVWAPDTRRDVDARDGWGRALVDESTEDATPFSRTYG